LSVNRALIQPQQSLNRTLIQDVPYWERWNDKNDDAPAKGEGEGEGQEVGEGEGEDEGGREREGGGEMEI
jgi:hypothetical protein